MEQGNIDLGKWHLLFDETGTSAGIVNLESGYIYYNWVRRPKSVPVEIKKEKELSTDDFYDFLEMLTPC